MTKSRRTKAKKKDSPPPPISRAKLTAARAQADLDAGQQRVDNARRVIEYEDHEDHKTGDRRSGPKRKITDWELAEMELIVRNRVINSKMTETCAMEGCERPPREWNLCTAHRKRARAYGIIPGHPCSVEGCTHPVYGRGLCARHYIKMRRTVGITGETCSTPGCSRPEYVHGICDVCDKRQRRKRISKERSDSKNEIARLKAKLKRLEKK